MKHYWTKFTITTEVNVPNNSYVEDETTADVLHSVLKQVPGNITNIAITQEAEEEAEEG